MTTHQPVPGSTPRSSPLPWFILFIVVLGFGVFTFRNQIAEVLSTDAQSSQSEVQVLTGEGMLTRIQNLETLETVAFHMQTVVTATKDVEGWQGYLWKQKALFIVDGTVTAGVDLSQLSSEDVRVSSDGKSVRVELPSPKVLDSDVEDMHLYSQERGLLKFGEVEQSLRAEAEADAKKKLLTTACASDILSTAERNAIAAVENLFALTEMDVFVTISRNTGCAES